MVKQKKLLLEEGWEVPEERGHRTWYALAFILVCVCTVKTLGYTGVLPIPGTPWEDFAQLCIMFSSFGMSVALNRFLLYLCEERKHVATRHNDSHLEAMKRCMTFHEYNLVYIFIVAAFSVSVYSWYDNKGQDLDLFFIILIVTGPVAKLFGLCDLSEPEHSHQYETQDKYLANGMAWRFYFGYLRVFLNENVFCNMFKDARTDDRLVGIINDVPRVNYIIIPRDGNCDKDLNEIQNLKNTLKNFELKQTTGGIIERVYRLQLYTVTHNKEKRNILLGYAQPVRTFYRMYESANTSFTKEDLKREVMLFYAKLKEILESHKEEAKYVRLVLVDSMENAGDEIAKRLFEASENDFEDLPRED